MADTQAVGRQNQNGTEHPFRLRLHQENEIGQDLRKRCVRGGHFQNPALIENEKLFLLNVRYIATNDHATRQLTVGTS